MASKSEVQFSSMNIDPRITKAIAALGWKSPTLVQEKAIPLCLEGHDVLARAKTGSGKTASYCIPAIQRVLERNKKSEGDGVKVIILLPTKELSLQVTSNIKELCSSCSRDISIVCVSNSIVPESQRTVLMERPDILVGTPSRILTHLQSSTIDIKVSLELLVIDEADLVFSFGYEEDITLIKSYLPPVYQAILMSATLSEDVLALKKLILNNPIVLKLEEGDLPEQSRLTQFYIKCLNADRYLLIYTLLKLKLIRGKTLLFVNDIQRCYKLKLFLEQFSIKSCVLNSELPHNSRCHIIEQFNSGLYDYVIATDELMQPLASSQKQVIGKKRQKKDKEYGVSRGIDFQGVENVVNFDLPPTVDSYIHRVGRTARGFDYGTALTFVYPEQEETFKHIEESLGQTCDDGVAVKPYKFKMSEIEGFRYRVEDALRKVSQLAIREARLKEIRAEILTSTKLKNHFDENPRDLQVLKHDKSLLSHKVQTHLKHIPPYLVPKVIRTADTTDKTSTMTGNSKLKRRKYHAKNKAKLNDPLKTLKVSSTKRPKFK